MNISQENRPTQLPADAVLVTKLHEYVSGFSQRYLYDVCRNSQAPVIELNGSKFISISEFLTWYHGSYKGKNSRYWQRQEHRIRQYLSTHVATRAMIENALNIRIPNVCRIVSHIKKDKNEYELIVHAKAMCPITKCKAEFLELRRKEHTK